MKTISICGSEQLVKSFQCFAACEILHCLCIVNEDKVYLSCFDTSENK